MAPDRFREILVATPEGDEPVLLGLADRGVDEPTASQRALLAAYLATNYEVGDPVRFVLHVNRPSRDLEDLLRALRAGSAAYLTAWNPLSERVDDAANDRAHERLVAAIRARGLASVDGYGRDPSGQWPGEHSLLVPGLALADACELGTRFRQAGILWADAAATPRLYVLDLPR